MKKAIISVLCLPVCLAASSQRVYTLEQVLDSARQNNISMRNGKRDVDIAGRQRKEAFTSYFPSVSATGAWFDANKPLLAAEVNPSEALPQEVLESLAKSMSPEAQAALGNPVSIGLLKDGALGGVTAVQPLFAGGRIVNGNRLAKVGQEVSRLQLQVAGNEVDKTVERYFWQIVSLVEKRKTLAAVDTMLSGIHNDVDVAVRAGVALRNDLLQVCLRQNDVESQTLKVDNSLALLKSLLAQFCGLADADFALQYDTALLALPEPLPPLPGAERQGCLRRLPEYRLLGRQVEADSIRQKMAVGQNLPSVAVGASCSYSHLLDKGQARAMVFATVSIPLSDWWGGSHAIRRRKIETLKAVDERRDKAELLQIRMTNAWNDVEEARKRLAIALRSIEQTEESLRLGRDYYRAGTSSMSDLLEVQLLYQQARDASVDAFADYRNSLVAYRQAVGQ